MILRKLLHPVILLSAVAMLYTGCGRKNISFIYLPPHVAVFTGNEPVPDDGTASASAMYIDVYIPTQDVGYVFNYLLPGNAAYALSLPEQRHIPLEQITDICVRPLSAYNSRYAALDDMSATCSFSVLQDQSSTISKDSLLNYRNSFMDEGLYTRFRIWLNESPSDISKQQFIVELITTDDARLADTTQTITLKP
ncbi:MAG: hypothetical protein KDC07_11540 [Chitinophagaceae bacterium]|nr:hypothetical protein [Chitinophagaceae bacterium]MCB9046148.1 hypothetical protein [Chitinophagales bacterium]